MQVNPEKLQQLAFLNPGPVERAIDSVATMPAAQVPQGNEYAEIFGGQTPPMAQAGPGLAPGGPKPPASGPTPQQMQRLMAQMQQPAQKPNFAPGSMPAPAPNLQFPKMQSFLGRK